MARLLIAVLVAVATFPVGAWAGETDTPVEIVRGTDGKAISPKVIEIAPEESAQAEAGGEAGSQQASKPSAQEAAKQAEDARARAERQRQIEELARKNQEQWRKAANALAGE